VASLVPLAILLLLALRLVFCIFYFQREVLILFVEHYYLLSNIWKITMLLVTKWGTSYFYCHKSCMKLYSISSNQWEASYWSRYVRNSPAIRLELFIFGTVATSRLALNVRFTTNGMCAMNNTQIGICGANNLYCCLLPQCKALRTWPSRIPIATGH